MEDFRYAEFEMHQKHQKLMREAQHARVVREARAHRLALLRRDPCW